MDKIQKCTVFICASHRDKVSWLETLLIQKFRPKLNKNRNKSDWFLFLKRKHIKGCKVIGKNRKTCGFSAMENGYCRIHGGEGLTWKDYVAEDMKKLGF